MNPFRTAASTRALTLLLSALVWLTALPGAAAQSYCSSDGQPQPAQLVERFINADCADCWTNPATPQATAGQVALDWVVPGGKGDDAPLSAVASRDALARLEALGQGVAPKASRISHLVRGLRGATLRVAHGLPVNDYIGASIELKPIPKAAKSQRWTAWLALVETLPVGAENSPVARNLIRNVLQSTWNGHKQLLQQEHIRFFESRPMNIPFGANPTRLRVIGWVEDEKGRVLLAAQSLCEALQAN